MELGIGGGTVVAERASGGLEGSQAGEGGATGLRMGEADEAEFETRAGGPELFAGVEEGEVVLAALEGADAEDSRDGLSAER